MLLPKLPLLSCAIFAICSPGPTAGGVRPSAVRTTAQPYTAGGRLAAAGCVSKILRRADARRARRGAPRSACQAHGSRFCVILLWIANQPVCPSMAFPGVRLIRAHAVTDCPVGFEIHWYQMPPFCCGGWPPAGTAGTKLGPSGPANGPGMASAPSRRDY